MGVDDHVLPLDGLVFHADNLHLGKLLRLFFLRLFDSRNIRIVSFSLVRENSWFSVIKNWLLPNRVYY
jgi:hypothetical protein